MTKEKRDGLRFQLLVSFAWIVDHVLKLEAQPAGDGLGVWLHICGDDVDLGVNGGIEVTDKFLKHVLHEILGLLVVCRIMPVNQNLL